MELATGQVLEAIKEYWFLITLLISTAASIAYMVVFRVTPWDKQREVKQRRESIQFHNQTGHALLEEGHFSMAKKEFEEALRLNAVDHAALNARYLTDLFLALDSPDWDPAVGLAVQSRLAKLGIIEYQKMVHVVEKYLGDLQSRIGQIEEATVHYEKALAMKPDYPDVLFTLGWFYYSVKPDVALMEHYFRKMSALNPYDYRGFHGLGYALYMQAIHEASHERRHKLIVDAAMQSQKAKDLSINRLNIVMDFGEVARSVDPHLALFYHTLGSELLEDPVRREAAGNAAVLHVRLLHSDGAIYLNNAVERRVWVDYQLAVDYLALDQQQPPQGGKAEHDRLVEKARKLDPSGKVSAVYLDQLAVLDRFLSA